MRGWPLGKKEKNCIINGGKGLKIASFRAINLCLMLILRGKLTSKFFLRGGGGVSMNKITSR